MEQITCKYCDKNFATQSSLNRHLENIHNLITPNRTPHDGRKYVFKCLEGCNVSFRVNAELRSHLKTSHKLDMLENTIYFCSENAFNEWLKKLSVNGIKYQKRFEKRTNDGEKSVSYFYCNRSGSVSNNPKRQMETKLCSPSRKIGTGCTSYIKLTIEGNKYTVKYSRFHYGHVINELQHVGLHENLRAEVGRKQSAVKSKADVNKKEKSTMNESVRNLPTIEDITGTGNTGAQIPENSKYVNDNFNTDMESEDQLLEKIKLKIGELRESLEKTNNIEVLTQVLDTVSNENILLSSYKSPKVFDIVHLKEETDSPGMDSESTEDHIAKKQKLDKKSDVFSLEDDVNAKNIFFIM